MSAAVNDLVARQVAARVDVVSDGETRKISDATCIRHRLTGFGIGIVPRAVPRDLDDFPECQCACTVTPALRAACASALSAVGKAAPRSTASRR